MIEQEPGPAALSAYLDEDREVRDRLADIEDGNAFASAACAAASAAGIAVSERAIEDAISAGISAHDRLRPTQTAWPDAAWLPVEVAGDGQDAVVIWRHFAGQPLAEPFFEDTLRRIRSRPINRLMTVRTPLSALADAMPPEDDRVPAGLVFHMSRCGSTLVSQMLGTLPGVTTVSEPPAFDAVVQIVQANPDVPADRRTAMLRAMAAALGRNRFAGDRHYVIKTDCWHTLALPVLRAAFPETPWVFLFRDPAEVMVSQMAMRGSHTVPGLLDDRIFGVDRMQAVTMPGEDYCALVLARICDAALAARESGQGLFLDYAELPDAVERRILPHFGIAPSPADLADMRRAGGRDAKAPASAFTSDTDAKRQDVSDEIRAAFARHLDRPWQALRAPSPSTWR